MRGADFGYISDVAPNPLLPKRMIEIHPAQAAHALSLWQGYCAELDGRVSDEATNGLWQRILSPREPIGSLLAFSRECEPVGFANYVFSTPTLGAFGLFAIWKTFSSRPQRVEKALAARS